MVSCRHNTTAMAVVSSCQQEGSFCEVHKPSTFVGEDSHAEVNDKHSKALHVACKQAAQVEVVRKLIESQEDVNMKDQVRAVGFTRSR